MTHDRALSVPDVSAAGSWNGRDVRVLGTLVVAPATTALNAGDERLLVLEHQELSDATLQAAVLTLHGQRGMIMLRSDHGLATVWARIVSLACTAPEVTRGLRALGRASADDAVLQKRFFGPLITARRRVHETDLPEQRMAHFDAGTIRARLAAALATFAAERFPTSPPDRRAAEAELEEATEQLFAQLETLESLAELVRSAPNGTMFTRWRSWAGQLREVFREADRSWPVISRAMRSPPGG